MNKFQKGDLVVIDAPKVEWVIMLQEANNDGRTTLLPAAKPKTYNSEAQAYKVAGELAQKNGGRFVVFRAIGHVEAPKPVIQSVSY